VRRCEAMLGVRSLLPPRTMGLLIAGLVLVAIGFDRLLNSYLMVPQQVAGSARLLIGVVCAMAGSLLLASAAYLHFSRR